MKDYIDNGENLKIKPIDLSIKNKQIVFFAILPFSSYAYIEAMNIISSCKEINEQSKILGTISKKLINALNIISSCVEMNEYKVLGTKLKSN